MFLKKIKWLCGVLILMFFSSCSSDEKKTLTIAAAANVQFAMEEIIYAFEEETAINCEMVVSSSGKLTAQIQRGAPFDVFVSADMKYPNVLFEKGFADELPEIYGFGKLVLWTLKEVEDLSIGWLRNSEVQHFAIAAPLTAPYGKAAIEVLTHFNVFEEIKRKLVYGESISQVNQFILTQSAEVGFTAKSAVLSPKLKGKGKWVELPSVSYQPIEQGVVVVKRNNTNQLENAKKFYRFLFSKKAKTILRNYGYQTK